MSAFLRRYAGAAQLVFVVAVVGSAILLSVSFIRAPFDARILGTWL